MGKGDRKTKKGKIAKGTFGVLRPHKPGNSNTEAVKSKTKSKAKKKAG